MASIVSDPNGRKRILFVASDGTRKPIRLGKMTMRQAEAFKTKVEDLVSAKLGGSTPDDETVRWLTRLDSVVYDKLAAVGLAAPRESKALGDWLDGYIKGRTDVKPGTATAWGHTRRCLVAFFGANKPLRAVKEGDADDFRLFLLGTEELSENTMRRRLGLARQFFRAAQRKGLVDKNPFSELKVSMLANPKKLYFISREEASKVMSACPDVQWRLLFALSRYGGLRCPSEYLGLKWEHVDWEHGKILIHSPKTEHHQDGGTRWIPLFPELRGLLLEAFEEAEPGTEHVISRYRDTNANLRTQFHRIIRRAGLTPWPKTFHNLRSTRETKLCENWPEHVVCKWLGNSRLVARKHTSR